MSVEQVKAFSDKIATDEKLKEKVKAARQKEDPSVVLPELAAIATAAGFDVTAEDFVAARRAAAELSDRELEMAAGGMCCSAATQCNCAPADCGH